jgi:hypothetical protein
MTIFARPEIGHGDQWWEVAAPDPADQQATAVWDSSTIDERKRAARQWFELMLDLTSPSRGRRAESPGVTTFSVHTNHLDRWRLIDTDTGQAWRPARGPDDGSPIWRTADDITWAPAPADR